MGEEFHNLERIGTSEDSINNMIYPDIFKINNYDVGKPTMSEETRSVIVPEHLLERSSRARERYGFVRNPQISNIGDGNGQHGSFLDDEAADFLAQEDNGGVCSIAVNNILIERERGENDENAKHGVIKAIYDTTLQEVKRTGFREVTKGIFKKRIETVYEEPKSRDFLDVSDSIELKSGVIVAMGFSAAEFGVLTNDGVFIPVIELNDRRHKQECSYATFMTTPVDCTVVVGDDEKVIIGEYDENRGSFVVAKEVLDQISILQSEQTGDEAETNLIKWLRIEDIVNEALGLNPAVDYRPEIMMRQLLANLEQINSGDTDGPVLLHEEKFEGKRGASTDRVEYLFASFDPAESDTYAELQGRVRHPNSIKGAEFHEVLRAKVGRFVGQLIITRAPDIEDFSDEQVIELLNSKLEKASDIKSIEARSTFARNWGVAVPSDWVK